MSLPDVARAAGRALLASRGRVAAAWALATLLALGALSGAPGISADEAAILSGRSAAAPGAQPAPPLATSLAAATRAVGASAGLSRVRATRLGSAVAGALLSALLAIAAWELSGGAAALLAPALFWLAPRQLHAGLVATPDVVLTALVLATALAWRRALAAGRRTATLRGAAVAGLLLGAAVLARADAWVILAALAAHSVGRAMLARRGAGAGSAEDERAAQLGARPLTLALSPAARGRGESSVRSPSESSERSPSGSSVRSPSDDAGLLGRDASGLDRAERQPSDTPGESLPPGDAGEGDRGAGSLALPGAALLAAALPAAAVAVAGWPGGLTAGGAAWLPAPGPGSMPAALVPLLAIPVSLLWPYAGGAVHAVVRISRAARGRLRARDVSDDLLLLCAAAAPLAAAALAGAARSARPWLPAVPFLALLGARAIVTAGAAAWPRRATAVVASVALLVLYPGLRAAATSFPLGTSAWNELLGGAPGAASRGLPRQDGGDAVVGLLATVNERARPGARVWWPGVSAGALDAYARDGRLRPDLVLASAPEDADLAVVALDGRSRDEEYRAWAALRTARPAAGVYREDVPLAFVYARPGAWR